MKLLHFSDLHIGVENYGRPDAETGMSTRLVDFLTSYDELVHYAISNEVDAVLFAGDAYKSRDPSQTHQREFAKRVARLAGENIPVYLLTGNHDLPAVAERASALEIFPTLDVEQVFVCDSLNTQTILTRSGPLQIVGLPWIRRSQYLTREDTNNLTLDQITSRLQERLTNALNWQLESLDPNVPSVLVAHVTASGSVVGSERSMMLGRDHVLMLSTLASQKLDYVALGHIHKHQVLNANPMVVYSGSLQRVDFSEERDEKGFCVIELDQRKSQGQRLTTFTFQTVQARPFKTIDVEVQANDSPTERVLEIIRNRRNSSSPGSDIVDAIVRVRIYIPEQLVGLLNDNDIREALHDAHYVSIYHHVERTQRLRITPEASRGLSPTEALKLYLETRGTDQDRITSLLDHADALIQEEFGEPSDDS
ncbi:MAG: exonuclease SbcCD subunit D [Chloroflexota bacterium]|nr:exonuclease SbcCD subunit D [Chloroflexota bacterium]